jgi:hypothetical protein
VCTLCVCMCHCEGCVWGLDSSRVMGHGLFVGLPTVGLAEARHHRRRLYGPSAFLFFLLLLRERASPPTNIPPSHASISMRKTSHTRAHRTHCGAIASPLLLDVKASGRIESNRIESNRSRRPPRVKSPSIQQRRRWILSYLSYHPSHNRLVKATHPPPPPPPSTSKQDPARSQRTPTLQRPNSSSSLTATAAAAAAAAAAESREAGGAMAGGDLVQDVHKEHRPRKAGAKVC